MEEFLHIEDDEQYVEYIRDILHAYYPVATKIHRAQSLQEGLEILRDPEGANISLVLLDLGLVDTRGPQSISLLFKEIPNKPVVVLTRNENENLRIQALNAGAQDYLLKDKFSNEHLQRAIQHALLRYRSQNELRSTAWEVERTNSNLQNLLRLNNVAGWEMDIVENVMQWDDLTYEMLGQSPQSLPNPRLKDYLDTVSGEDKEQVADFFNQIMNATTTDDHPNMLEHRSIIHGNTIKHFCLRGTLRATEDGIKLVGSVQDITDQKSLELTAPIAEHNMQEIWQRLKTLACRLNEPMQELFHYFRKLEKLSLHKQEINSLETKFAIVLDIILEQLNAAIISAKGKALETETIPLKDWENFANMVVQMYPAERSAVTCRVVIAEEAPIQIETDRPYLAGLTYNLLRAAMQTGETCSLKMDFKTSKNGAQYLSLHLRTENSTSNTELETLAFTIQKLLKKPAIELFDNDPCNKAFVIAKILNTLNGSIKFDKSNVLKVMIPVNFSAVNKKERLQPNAKVLVAVRESIIKTSIKQKMQTHFEHVELEITRNLTETLEKMKSEQFSAALIDTQLPSDGKTRANGVETIKKMKSLNGTPIIAMLHETTAEYQANIAQAGAYACVTNPPRSEELLEILPPLLKIQN